MLTSTSQTTPAVPISMKKAQENVSGSMGDAPGAHGPIVDSTTPKVEKLTKPKKKLPIKYIIAGILLALLLIGGSAAYYLSSISQDVRQRATGCTYWNGGAATEGACDNRGGIMQECKGGYWSAPSAGKCGATGTETGVVVTPTAACANDLESCENQPCCGTSVCQGEAGQRVCQNSGLTADQLCPGGACTGYYSFQCDSLSVTGESSGEQVCQDNGQFHGTDAGGAQARANATGCGQWDQVCVGGSNEGKLCGGFSIINDSCGTSTGGGGDQLIVQVTPDPTNEPSPTPEVSPSPTPEVSPSPSASPDVTPSPLPVGCGEPCTVSTDCAEANHICYEYADDGNPDGGICRLINNPTSSSCVEPSPSPSPTPTVGCNEACVTSADCLDTDHSCNASTNTCRLTVNPGDANCAPAPSPTPTPAPGCNQTCYKSSECSFASAVCYDNLCRLDTNPTNTACQAKTTTGTFYQQPALPQALPQSGSEDILNWLKVGLGALGLGLVFLFL